MALVIVKLEAYELPKEVELQYSQVLSYVYTCTHSYDLLHSLVSMHIHNYTRKTSEGIPHLPNMVIASYIHVHV